MATSRGRRRRRASRSARSGVAARASAPAAPRIGILRVVRRRLLPLCALVVLAGVAIVIALGSGGDAAKTPADASAAPAPANTPRTLRASSSPTAPARRRAQVVEPVAGESAATAALPVRGRR